MSRKPTRGRPTQKAVVRRKKKASIIDRIMARIPLSHGALHRVATWTIVIVVLGGVYIAGSVSGVNAKVGTAIAEQVGKAGLRVEQIEVRGVKRMDVTTVYAVALDQKSRAMPLVDLDAVRNKLMQYPWVLDAHVSRRLPDTLFIRIDERTPAAVWQTNNQLYLIDRDGNYLEQVSQDAIPELPRVVGPDANKQEPAYQALMNSVPALRPRVQAAIWVGNRRWNLQFDTGELLLLPEDGPADALRLFAQKNAAQPMLGHGLVRIDMRDPTRMVIRKAGPGQNSSDPAPTSNKPTTAEKSDRAALRDPV
ncbi:MAG: cell division protein FtsQ/DivIB [Sphingomonas sp.]|uniref:cell division protein FtsQ/DivIB n=1 Tax=Sphingomonas sp. TaxID=28214 RepID=UPI001AC814B0|nr:cell division protein FtsQ/DivIB [Sphingomonas sp.]MBN8808349.1 cell division protein FtsQ/DivIB [Sphingomonas sp.]